MVETAEEKSGPEAAFPKAWEWKIWWDFNRPVIPHEEPWVRFWCDATANLQMAFVRMSRVVRKKPAWDRRGSVAGEDKKPLAVAEEEMAWFDKHRPPDKDLPRWAQIGFRAIWGAHKMLVRLAREVELIQGHGYKLVNVSAEICPKCGTQIRDVPIEHLEIAEERP